MNMSHVHAEAPCPVPAAEGVRRRPVQARSQARVERILDAATTLVDEAGVDAATTRAIAERAGVPVASIYQFFADREAVLDAIVKRQLAPLDTHVGEALAEAELADLAAFVDFAVEVHRDWLRDHPSFASIWLGGRTSPPVTAEVHARHRRLAHAFHAVLLERRLLRPATPVAVLELTLELGDRVFEFAYRQDPDGDETTFGEGKRALTAYLDAYRTR